MPQRITFERVVVERLVDNRVKTLICKPRPPPGTLQKDDRTTSTFRRSQDQRSKRKDWPRGKSPNQAFYRRAEQRREASNAPCSGMPPLAGR
jgi:hypothetical protein